MSCWVLRACLFGILLAHIISKTGAGQFYLTNKFLLIIWCVLYLSDNFSAGLIDRTCSEYVQVSSRKTVAKLNLTFQFAGLCVGLLASFLVLQVSMENVDRSWPSFNTV